MFETEDFRKQIGDAISAQAGARGLAVSDKDQIVNYLQNLATANEKDLMEREKAGVRGTKDAIQSATVLAADAAVYAVARKSNDLILRDIQDAYLAKFCQFWPFCK